MEFRMVSLSFWAKGRVNYVCCWWSFQLSTNPHSAGSLLSRPASAVTAVNSDRACIVDVWAMSKQTVTPSPILNAAPERAWPRVRNFIGGYFSGMALVAVGHPFDTLKVRLQTEGQKGRS